MKDEVPTPPPTGPVPASDSPLDQITDDGRDLAELKAWIYAEFCAGKMSEEIAAELKQQGWPADDIDGLVEEGRKATRSRRR